ncbi:MAG: response regulator transcription factor [Phycisphaeraceae bacterium]|nr:response regulator transcription factor [Phycisphaeraceae bacterium]
MGTEASAGANRVITVVMADDQAMVRQPLAAWLRQAGDVKVLAEVSNADEAVTAAIRERPDIVLMDIDMPGLLAFDAVRTIKSRCPRTRVIVLSGFFHDRYIQEALSAEASGYVTKGEPPEVVLSAVRTVAGGGVYFSPQVQERLVVDSTGVHLAAEGATRASTLTSREMEVLRYIARGLSKKDIAAIMHLSVKTVDNHSTSLMSKLNIHDRVELARYAIREGLAEA